MSATTPELLTIFLDEAFGYARQLADYANDSQAPLAMRATMREVLDNLKGVSALVGLPEPQLLAEKLQDILAETENAPDRFGERARPLIDGLSAILTALRDGKPGEIPAIMEEALTCEDGAGELAGLPSDLSNELMDIFLSEGKEAGLGMQQSLELLAKDPYNIIERNTFFRHLINLKGAAGMVNQRELTAIADMMQTAFDAIEGDRLQVTDSVNRFFTEGIQAIVTILRNLKRGEDEPGKNLMAFRENALEQFPNLFKPGSDASSVVVEDDGDMELTEAAIQRELQKVFAGEAQDHLTEMRQLILDAQEADPAPDLVQRMFRVAHTLKGAAATAGFDTLSGSAHQLENVLDRWRSSGRGPDEKLISLLYEAERLLGRMVAAGEGKGGSVEMLADRLKRSVENFLADSPQHVSADPPAHDNDEDGDDNGTHDDSSARNVVAPSRTVRVPIDRLDQLINLVSELNSYRMRLDTITGDFVSSSKRLKWERRNLNKVIGDFQRKYQWEMPVPGLPTPEGSEFSDLEFDRYSDLNIFTRNLEELDFKISGILENLEQHLLNFGEDSNTLGALVTTLREEMIQVRMVPVQSLFRRIEFQTRQLARELGKQVRIVTSGGQTEIDKSLNEALAEPILHLIRNCLDHGFESPDVREAAGKSPEGLLTVSAQQEERSVILHIADDGRGIDVDKLKAVALKEGIFKAGELDARSHEDLLPLIFYPQISTRDTAGAVSGRGVGMDVVRHAISELYGSIHVESEPGKGTRFTITVPLTLAVQPILTVTAEPHVFNLPMHYVVRILEPEEMEQVGEDNTLQYAGERLPVRWLGGFLGQPHDSELSSHPAVILETGERHMVLVVDAVTGREEAIVRTLTPLLDACTHFLGTTISSQGDVRLVLNVPFLFEMESDRPAISAPRFEPQERVKVLIADDSLSVRQTIKMLLAKRGIKANTAKDGLVAWQKLHGIQPHLMIVDLEMPNLNGFELMERVRQSPEFTHLPMLVLTSRGGAKHHQKAMTCGADGFLTKPALERELISRIRSALPPHLRELLDTHDPRLKA